MPDVQVVPLDFAGFRANASHHADTLTVSLLGNADMRHAPALATFMPGVHADAIRLKVQETTIDFRELEFMSSGCFKALVSFLVKIQDLPSENRYRVRLCSDPNKHWQLRSFAALKSFASDTVVIDS